MNETDDLRRRVDALEREVLFLRSYHLMNADLSTLVLQAAVAQDKDERARAFEELRNALKQMEGMSGREIGDDPEH